MNTLAQWVGLISRRHNHGVVQMPDYNSKDETKAIIKEALKEWMDEKFLMFGRWSASGIAAAAFAALIYLILRSQGWHK